MQPGSATASKSLDTWTGGTSSELRSRLVQLLVWLDISRCPVWPTMRYMFDVKPLVHPTENLVSEEMCKAHRCPLSDSGTSLRLLARRWALPAQMLVPSPAFARCAPGVLLLLDHA